MRTPAAFVAALLLVGPSLPGCGGTPAADHCTVAVAPAGGAEANRVAIQGALATAKPGDTVCLKPGSYPLQAELSLSTANVELRGTSDGVATLDFTGQASGANGLSVTADGFTATHLVVQDTAGDGIRVTQAKHVVFRDVTVNWTAEASTGNGAYGLYPVQCTGVLIDGCKVHGASDAGIYVGQSSQVLVKDSEAWGNVAGIEIENTTDSEVTGCYAHDNTGGILVFNLPGLQVSDGKRANVHDNRAIHNDGINFAAPSGIVHVVPTGTGMLLMSSDDNEIHGNDVTGNDSVGIAVVSYLITGLSITDMAYDPYPEGNSVHDNRMAMNGALPDGLAYTLAAAASYKTIPDLVWDGLASASRSNADGSLTNCFQANGSATFANMNIGSDGLPHPMTDPTPFACSHPALPSITP